jgi:CheY-like chemotaxis protein
VADDLWPCDFDRNQIAQVISNIVINAQQAMPLGGTVTISAVNVSLKAHEKENLQDGKYVKISIHDEGSGIPHDILPRIFDPFFTTKQKGSGLGLSICYSIMKRHDGWIEAQSVDVEGATFNLYMPASVKASADASLPKTASIHRGTGRILIMDDEEIILMAAGRFVATMGYSVECRREGKETVHYLREEIRAGRSFAAIILDLTIPGGMGGKDVAVEIQKMDLKIPLFVASGYSNDPVMANPNDYGFCESICKPFTIDELSAMFNRHLHNT